MRTFLWLALGVGLCLPGCGLAYLTSREVDCSPSEIQISNEQRNWFGGRRSWTAVCRGVTYRCTSRTTTSTGSTSTSATATAVACIAQPVAVSPVSAPFRAPTGCSYDTQCKGNRVCHRGECVNPGRAPPRRRIRARPRRRPPAQPLLSFAERIGATLGDAARYKRSLGLATDHGVVILSVTPKGAAARHRLARGDVIVALALERIRHLQDVQRVGRRLSAGKPFHIIVMRKRRLHTFKMRYRRREVKRPRVPEEKP